MPLKIAVLLYDNFTMLDAVGPLEVLSLLPDADVFVVAETAGVIYPDNQALPFIASYSYHDVTEADLVLVPGGPGSIAMESHQPTLDWLRNVHARSKWTCSVCTGSLILGAAGLLTGLRATSHWAVRERLTEFGATPEDSRWVEQDRIVTAAGVSAGIDMALHLVSLIADASVAKAIQLGIEYDPQPPFDSGAIEKATPDVVAAVANGSIAMNREGRARPRLPRLG
jgi:transcriptional regulator GlxA family with amidase domain